jgi:hypothetical protein
MPLRCKFPILVLLDPNHFIWEMGRLCYGIRQLARDQLQLTTNIALRSWQEVKSHTKAFYEVDLSVYMSKLGASGVSGIQRPSTPLQFHQRLP